MFTKPASDRFVSRLYVGPDTLANQHQGNRRMSLRTASLLTHLLDRVVNQHPRFRLFIVKLFLPDRDVDIELHGSRLRINTRKELGFLRASKLAHSNWVLGHEVTVLTTLAFLLEPTDTFVDIGANVGLYASVISRAASVFPEMRLYAFEPNPDTLKRLHQTHLAENVKIFGCALSDQEGELEFCEGAGSATFGVKHAESPFQIKSHTVRVKARSLDSISIEGDSIVLKIDVENHEAEVLKGARRLLHSGRVKAVYLDGYLDKTIPALLRTLGFELFDGHTLERAESESSLLAIHVKHLERWARLRRLSAAG